MALLLRLVLSVIALVTAAKPQPTPAQRIHAAALVYVDRVKPHQVFGWITSRRLGLQGFRVYEGTANPRDLDRGPGHYPSTTVPGLGGTVAIAGHRVTPVGGRPYGPFYFIDKLRRGDRIVLRVPYATFVYRVARHVIVPARATWFERYAGRERLVLSACTPKYTALQRWVVFARLVKAVPARSLAPAP
jgi:sortase A